jgi:hypothetical protein
MNITTLFVWRSNIADSWNYLTVDVNTLQEHIFIEKFIMTMSQYWSLIHWREAQSR